MKNTKKFLALLLAFVMVWSVAACSTASDDGETENTVGAVETSGAEETDGTEAAGDAEETSQAEAVSDAATVVITCLDENGEAVEKEVPANPERVAILDYAVLDVLDVLGYGDTVVSSAEGTIAYLQSYWDKMESGEIVNLGNLQTWDIEALQQSEPDIIFIGGRQSSRYAELEQIAPVVYLSVTAGNVYEETIENAKVIAAIFGEDASVIDQWIEDNGLSASLEALQAVAVNEDGSAKTAGVLMYTDESTIGVLASTGRCSLIGNEIGFEILSGSDANHGDAASFETLAELNPDYFFVLNRGYITSNGGSSNDAVREALINKVTETTTSTFVIMDNPDAWYTAEGGIQALKTMLDDLTSQLLQ